jgi:hypothetical protein
MIDTLITALSKELELSAEEIADTIWLALQIQESQSGSTATQKLKNDVSHSSLKSKELEGETLPETKTQTSDSGATVSKSSPEEQKAGIYPRNQQETLFKSELSFKVPNAPSLREPLTLARALKPLMRRIPCGTTLVLDESATTQRIADEGLWLPVLRPILEPWLDLELVVDEGISMQIWRHTISELERLLKNYGIFRDVRVWGLITDNLEQVQIRRGIGATAKNQSPRSPAELIDPSGRRLVLVVSDCVSSLWRDRKVTTTLEIWAKQGSMAIVQMLPNWLWKRTALGRASEVRLQGLNPGEFNQKLIAKEVSLWDELEEMHGVKVPVFTLEPDKVATWAQMLSGKGGIWTSGYVFKLDPIPVNKRRELFNLNYSQQSAEQRVQAFRVTASPMARKLAGLLAAAPAISLPIVRLIQKTLLKESQQVHVAEIFLGGLLKPLSEINAETNPDYVQYEFMDGVRELLVDSVPSGYMLNVVEEVSKYVARKAGLSLEDFAAVLMNPQQVRDSDIAGDFGYFATVTAQVLRRLGGEYTRFAEELEKQWNYLAVYEREKRERSLSQSNQLEAFQTAYRNLGLSPLLDTKESERFRVDYGSETISELEHLLEENKSNNCIILFAGYRGCGKSTLLAEFSHRLERRYFVVFFSIFDILEISAINHISILIAICVQMMAKAEAEQIGIDRRQRDSLYQWLYRHTLTTTEALDTLVESGYSLFDIIARELKINTLMYNEDFKKNLGDMIEKINLLAAEIKVACKKDIVVIIDDLDKLDFRTAQEIYQKHIRALIQLKLPIVFTIPTSLIHTNSRFKLNIANEINHKTVIMPIAQLFKRGESRQENLAPDLKTMAILEQLINKRIAPELIEPEVITKIITYSGGVLREILIIVNECCRICLRRIRKHSNSLKQGGNQPNIIIDLKVLAEVINKRTVEFDATLGQKDYEILEQIYINNRPDDPSEPRFWDLLHGLYVLEYRDSQIWYNVHPIVANLLKQKLLD